MSYNSTAVKWWKTPPLDPELRIHLFNYTNADRFLKGQDKKLIVEDLGPYVYIEKFEKVNVTFNDNYTISYKVSMDMPSKKNNNLCFQLQGKSILQIYARKI